MSNAAPVMGADEKRVRLAADMYRARDDMRMLLGDEYEAKMERYRRAVRVVAAQVGGDEIAAVTEIVRRAHAKGMELGGLTAVALVAAAVDVIEADGAARAVEALVEEG